MLMHLVVIRILAKNKIKKVDDEDSYVLGSRFCASFPVALFSCFPAIRQQDGNMCQPAIGRNVSRMATQWQHVSVRHGKMMME